MKLETVVAALGSLIVIASLLYGVNAAENCWGRGTLVKNAWGGLSCIPLAK